jgi:DHA1 family bicyclomycin/chloramphenicol resistance-like MFS transporter
MTFAPKYLPWILSLGMAAVLMSADIYAPCLPGMVQEFKTIEASLQWTLSINAIGNSLASPFVGPLADTYGRKRVISISILLYIFASIGCGLAPTISALQHWRLAQGLFAAALPIASSAMIADVFSGRKFGSIMAYMGILITASFAFAPMIGGWAGEQYSWRVLFFGLAGTASLFLIVFQFFPETVKKKTPFSPKNVLKTYGAMFQDKVFVLLGLMTAFSLAGFFAYITASSYLYIDQFGLSQSEFGFVTALGMATNAFAHLIVGNLIARFGNYKVLRIGIFLVSISALLMSVMTFYDVRSPYLLLVPVLFYNASLGFVFPPSSTIALERYPHCTGAASAFLGTIRMTFLGAGALAAGFTYNGSLSSISSLLILFAGLVVIAFIWVSLFIKQYDPPKANVGNK